MRQHACAIAAAAEKAAAEVTSEREEQPKSSMDIINDIIDFSRIEAGHFELENENFDLHRCLEDAIDLSAGAAYKKGPGQTA